MRLAACALLGCVATLAQVAIDERRAGPALAKLEESGKDTLRCSISPIRPQLNYSLRFQAGYVVTMPLNQFEGSGHRWRVLLRVTPEAGGPPVYLTAFYRLPTVPKTKQELQVAGGYLLGEGSYRVRSLVIDDAGRTYRKEWRTEVKLGRNESKAKPGIPPGAVWDMALRGSRMLPAAVADDAQRVRLTILLHAAPAFIRRTRLRPGDTLMLLASVTSIMERVPTSSVRMVAFNLDQQKELYRKEGFRLRDVPELANTMNRVELDLVDVKVLQNRRGHLGTIADMVNGEFNAASASDIVLFLGPLSRFGDKVPQEVLEAPGPRGPQWLYFQLVPLFRGGRGGVMAAPTVPDSITRAVSKLGGKTSVIHTPGDLAKAIDRLEKMTKPDQRQSSATMRLGQ